MKYRFISGQRDYPTAEWASFLNVSRSGYYSWLRGCPGREEKDSAFLYSVHRRKRYRSLTDSRKSRGDGYANLTKGLEISSPFQVLSSDISCIRTDEGFEYICQIRDVQSMEWLNNCYRNNGKLAA
jgi:hypothetical protein